LNFDASGVLQTIDLKYENLTGLISEGIDLEASYTMELGAGELALRYMTTHYMSNATDNGVTIREQAGENTSNTPDFVHRGTARYSMNDLSFTLTARGHSDGVVDNRWIECQTNCPVSTNTDNRTINDNSIDGQFFFDAYGSYDIEFGGGQAELFISVKNLFDTDPEFVPFPLAQGSENRPGYQQANRNLSDVLGRNFRMGMRYEF
jgi:hypothetical protein